MFYDGLNIWLWILFSEYYNEEGAQVFDWIFFLNEWICLIIRYEFDI